MEHSTNYPKIVGAYGSYEVVTSTLKVHFTSREDAEIFAETLQKADYVECICG